MLPKCKKDPSVVHLMKKANPEILTGTSFSNILIMQS